MIVARNPAQYGFDIIAHDPIAYDKVTVPRAIDLRRVAEWTGVSIDEIQALNPELRRWTTPVRYADFQLKVPAGTGATFESRLAEAAPSDMTALKWYTVKASRIARDDRPQAQRQPHRPRRGQQPLAQVAGQRRPGTDHPARPRHAARRAHRADRTGGRRLAGADRHGRRRRRDTARPEPDRLPRQARRHALVDRPAVRHHRRRTSRACNRLRGNAVDRRRPGSRSPADASGWPCLPRPVPVRIRQVLRTL